jgi:transcriptional regulator with XRE-family HTH domain
VEELRLWSLAMKIDKKGFADRLQAALQRERMALSAPELQRLLELEGVVVSKVAVSNWLSGKYRPRPHHLEALAKIVGVEPHELEYRESRVKGVREVNTAWPDHVRGLDRLSFEAYLTLSRDKQKLVRELITELAKEPSGRKR